MTVLNDQLPDSNGQSPKLRERTVGLLLALGAAASSAGFVVPYKQASVAAPASLAAFALLLAAAILNSLIQLVQRRVVPMRAARATSRRALWLGASTLAILAVVGNSSSARALEVLGPATVSAVLRSEVLVVGTMGIWFLGERPTKTFWFGACLALAGLLVLKGEGLVTPNGIGVSYALVAATCFSGMQITARRLSCAVNPIELNSIRLWLSCSILAAWPNTWANAFMVDRWFWINVTLAAAFGPVLSRMLLMYAVRYITAGMCTLVMLVAPVFAMGLGAVVLHQLPAPYELWGAALMLAGIALPVIQMNSAVLRVVHERVFVRD